MRLISQKKRKKLFLIYRLTAILLIFVLLLVFFDKRIRPVVKRKVRDCARTETVYILNTALLEQINSANIKYSDLARVCRNASGEITSIETDTSASNRFKATFALTLTKALDEIEHFDFSLRLGTLIGPEILTDTGPKIPFRVSSSEYVQTEIESSFEEAGINQTVHKIFLEVSVNLCCYFPGYSTSVTVHTELTIAETVIVGAVPQFYIN